MTDHAKKTDTLPRFDHLELLSPGWINKYLLTYEQPDGRMFTYESISRKNPEEYAALLENYRKGEMPIPDAVCIVPLLPHDEVLLIKEFRYPINSFVVAFPAGLIDAGEDPLNAVERELHEETGCRIRREFGDDAVQFLSQSGFTSVGFTEENVRVALVMAEPEGDAEPELNEFIDTFKLKREDIGKFLETNKLPIGTRAQLLLEVLKRSPAWE